jgi:hypothetical protein
VLSLVSRFFVSKVRSDGREGAVPRPRGVPDDGGPRQASAGGTQGHSVRHLDVRRRRLTLRGTPPFASPFAIARVAGPQRTRVWLPQVVVIGQKPAISSDGSATMGAESTWFLSLENTGNVRHSSLSLSLRLSVSCLPSFTLHGAAPTPRRGRMASAGGLPPPALARRPLRVNRTLLVRRAQTEGFE